MSKDKGVSRNGERPALGKPRAAARAARPRVRRAETKASAAVADTRVSAGTFAPVTDEYVRVRAYYLYLDRQGHSHDPLADWLQAEREMASSAAQTAD